MARVKTVIKNRSSGKLRKACATIGEIRVYPLVRAYEFITKVLCDFCNLPSRLKDRKIGRAGTIWAIRLQ
jgi:hypothetical protein